MIRDKLQEDIRQLRIIREPTSKQVEQLEILTMMLESFDSRRKSLEIEFKDQLEYEEKFEIAIKEVSLIEYPSGVVFDDA